MTETLLTPSSVKLYGRVLNDLTYNYDPTTVKIADNNFLQHQLHSRTITFTGNTTNTNSDIANVNTANGIEKGMEIWTPSPNVFDVGTTILDINPGPPITISVSKKAGTGAGAGQTFNTSWRVHLARIYAFSFEGAIYGMPKPAIFIVHGPGLQVPLAHRSTVDESGVVAREWEFAGQGTVSYWEYEKGDFSLRLDTDAGPLEQILLAAAIRGADMGDRSGANLGIRSGANLSGANVSGANVSGANLSGANVSGANVRNR